GMLKIRQTRHGRVSGDIGAIAQHGINNFVGGWGCRGLPNNDRLKRSAVTLHCPNSGEATRWYRALPGSSRFLSFAPSASTTEPRSRLIRLMTIICRGNRWRLTNDSIVRVDYFRPPSVVGFGRRESPPLLLLQWRARPGV